MQQLITCALSLLVAASVSAQTPWYVIGNGSTNPVTNYVGTTDNNALMLRTNAIQRLRLNANQSYTIGAFGAQAKNGALGLSPNNTLWVNGPGPFSRLHLHDGTTSVLQSPYRPWMDNGITFTTNSDQMYIGHKVESGSDQTSAVIQWGDNDGAPVGPDVLKFLFASAYTGGTYGVGGLNARELGRFHPQGFFGLGDWQSAGLQPLERLDLLHGRIKVRQLPTDPAANTMTKVLVVDDSSPFSPEYGVVKWRDVSTLGGCSSGWSLNGSNAVTAFDGNPCPPQTAHFVGIGLNNPVAKLDVIKDGPAGTFDYGMRLRVATTTAYKSGLDLSILTSGAVSWGYRAKVEGATINYGMDIAAGHGVSGGAVIGGQFFAGGGGVTANDNVRGISTGSNGSTGGGSGWAIWAEGKAFLSSGTLWSSSDEQLKQDVQDLDRAEALDKLLAIETKSYSFDSDQYGFMGLEGGEQRGVLSQQLESVFPDLVRDVHRAGRVDSVGNALEPDVDFKAVNYMGLIPVMIAAIQEQQATITAQNERLAQLEQSMAICCTAVDGSDQRMGTIEPDAEGIEGDARMLSIVPNPFSDPPMVHYTLERNGRMQLLVNSSDGKQLQVLEEGNRSAGQYSYVWRTGNLAAGLYYVTLLLDGEPLVKRAVKVQ